MENERKIPNLPSVGEKGVAIMLKKTSIKKGEHSGVKPGKIQKIILGKPIKVGFPIVKRVLSTRDKRFGKARIFQKSGVIVGITPTKNEKKFVIETVTSFYEVRFL